MELFWNHSCVPNRGMRHRYDCDGSFEDSVIADNLVGNCFKTSDSKCDN